MRLKTAPWAVFLIYKGVNRYVISKLADHGLPGMLLDSLQVYFNNFDNQGVFDINRNPDILR